MQINLLPNHPMGLVKLGINPVVAEVTTPLKKVSNYGIGQG